MATIKRTKPDPDEQVAIPAVGYLRCSTDQQTDASIPAQRAAIEEWAAGNDYRIVAWYEDAGVSGWKDTREGFQRLIDDAEKRKNFRAIIVWDQNRFSRFPPVEACYYWHRLDQADVHLASVNQGRIDWHSIAGFLTSTIRQHADSEHRHKLSADVTRGLRRMAEAGCWVGKLPTGYDLDENRRLVPNGQAWLITRIFNECREGHTLRSIVKRLNTEGIPSPQGGAWARSTIANILANEVYTGLARCKDIELPNHPALVDPETMRIVQEILTARKSVTTPLVGGGPFVLTGLLKCGKCGCAMRGRTDSPNTQCYICSSYSERGICEKSTTHQSELLDHVIGAIEEHWMDTETVDRIRAAVRELMEAQIPHVDPRPLEKQFTAITTKLDKAKHRLVEVDRDMVPIVQDSIRELQAQRVEVEAALKSARLPRAALLGSMDERIDAAVQRFTQLREVLDRANLETQREVLRQTLFKVEVWTKKEAGGHRGRYRLEKGAIHLRGVSLVQLTHVFRSPPSLLGGDDAQLQRPRWPSIWTR